MSALATNSAQEVTSLWVVRQCFDRTEVPLQSRKVDALTAAVTGLRLAARFEASDLEAALTLTARLRWRWKDRHAAEPKPRARVRRARAAGAA